MGLKKESVHIKVSKDLYDKLEKMRILPHSSFVLARSDVYCETLFYGHKIQEIKRELGEKDFERVWNLLNKLNLAKLNLEKIDLAKIL